MSVEKYKSISQELSLEFGTIQGQMFGKPCLKTPSNKAFAAFFQDEMVFKLGAKEINLLEEKYPGASNWDPSGKNRPMKDWLQVPSEFNNDWKLLAIQAFNYTS